MDNKRLLNIFVIVFIDLLGFGLILPLLPFYAEVYGATPLLVGLLTAAYAAAQLVGAPLLGRLSDRFGRRPLLLVSILGTFLGFIIFGIAEPAGGFLAARLGVPQNAVILGILFFSRFLDGFTGGNISVAQAYITDVTDEGSRAKGLGLVGAAFGLGFIFGPALGGFLSGYGFEVPAFAAAGLAALNLLMVLVWLPESLSPQQRKAAEAAGARPRVTLKALLEALKRPEVGPILGITFFYGLAFALFTTMFSLFSQYRLKLDARQTGYVLAYVGLLVALVQGLGVGAVAKRFPERWIIFISTPILALSLAAWAFTPNLAFLLVVLVPLALTSGMLNTILRSSLTKTVEAEEVGGILGLAASLESATRVLAPSLGGLLLGSLGSGAPGAAAAIIMVGVFFYAWARILPVPARA
jgi:DHA1 family tetracycline resistance protein-like MFS transporter